MINKENYVIGTIDSLKKNEKGYTITCTLDLNKKAAKNYVKALKKYQKLINDPIIFEKRIEKNE